MKEQSKKISIKTWYEKYPFDENLALSWIMMDLGLERDEAKKVLYGENISIENINRLIGE